MKEWEILKPSLPEASAFFLFYNKFKVAIRNVIITAFVSDNE